MNSASLTGAEIASRVPVSSADAIAALSPERAARMRVSMTARILAMVVA